MSEQTWAGLVTNASPYAIPPGAAVEQVNIVNYIPGQLTSRGGMKLVAADVGVDICPYLDGGTVKLLSLSASGVSLVSVSNEASIATPTEPVLSPSSGQVQSSYTGRFHDYAGEPPA